MNLTFEVKDGILNHTGNAVPATLEGQIVKFSDRIAYINHDIDDALRSGVIKESSCLRIASMFSGMTIAQGSIPL
jgi:dGTPase